MQEAYENIFEKYFSGEMSPEDRKSFTNRLEEEADFADAYQLFIGVKKASHLIARDEMRQQLDQIVDSKKQASKVLPLWMKIISAAAILGLAFFAYQMNFDTIESSSDIYANHFEAYTPSMNRSESIPESTIKLYNNGAYQIFLNQSKSIDSNPEISLLQAMSYIQLKQDDQALQQLKTISDESALRDRKYWYLGLIHLKSERHAEAKQCFSTLASMSNFKKKEVAELLDFIASK